MTPDDPNAHPAPAPVPDDDTHGDDKATQPMQADGAGTQRSGDDAPGKSGTGESQGGAYPNPHSGKPGGRFEGGESR